MISVARRRLISVIIAMALLYGSAMLSARGVNLKWLLLPLMFPGLKAALLFFPGGTHGAHASGYLRLSVLLSFVLLCVVIESIRMAWDKMRTGKLEKR
jgi:hypothetical protein